MIRGGNYPGHSFPIRVATTAATCAMSDSLIETLGRWESIAYTLYIRTPHQVLRSFVGSLVRWYLILSVKTVVILYKCYHFYHLIYAWFRLPPKIEI